MAFKRRGEPATIEDEREALRAQRAALEDLKRQLAERVQAVRERELELHHALAEARARWQERGTPRRFSPPPCRTAGRPTRARTRSRQNGANSARGREQAIAAAEAGLVRASSSWSAAEASGTARARYREDALEASARRLSPSASRRLPQVKPARRARAARHRASRPRSGGRCGGTCREPDAARLEQIEARLAELRDAEKLFLRTRDELAGRSEAVAARERLVAQKERELDDREDGVGQWAGPELTEMEARLRRLEQQQPGEQTLGFSGGLRKLQQGTTRPQRDALTNAIL